jgi:two-component system sensor histidine kinase KdpD
MNRGTIPWRALLWSAGITAGATALSTALFRSEEPANHLIVYLIGVLFVASRYGFWPSALAAVLSVLASDFLLIQPTYSFAVARPQDGVTLGVFLLAALATSRLTADLRARGDEALRREQRVRFLYELTRALAGVRSAADVAEAAGQQFAAATSWRCELLLAGPDGRLLEAGPARGPRAPGADMALAQWALAQRQPAGWGTSHVPQQGRLYVPLGGPAQALGVLVLQPAGSALFLLPEQRQLIDTTTSLIGQALERIRLAREAQEATVRVQTESLRNSLLSGIAHDLRTPLASIIAASGALLQDRSLLSEQQARELTQTILDESRRMSQLADDTLEMARLEAGNLTLRREWYPVEEIVGAVLSRLESVLRHHRVETQLPAATALTQVDAVMIVRVLENLLVNAVKYSRPGTRIQVRAQIQAGATRLFVADEGPGLAAGEEARIFEKFYRGAAAAGQNGVGLGLAICRVLVEAHGGTIEAHNRPGGGAEFALTIPHSEVPPQIPADEEPLHVP